MTPLTECIRHNSLEKILEIAKVRGGEVKQRALGPQLYLPGFEDTWRVIPNHLARSCLFAPIRRGMRKRHDKTQLASRKDVRILYSGLQLDEADRDVLMQLIFEARAVPLGERIFINRAAFLRALKRHTGKGDYAWLHSVFSRLFEAALYIETTRYRVGHLHRGESWLHLIKGADFDEVENAYWVELDPRVSALFGNQEYALIDWDIRMQIAHHVDMAKWLQCLIATSKDKMQRYRITDLKNWMASATPLHKFRTRLMAALSELERLGVIAEPHPAIGQRGQNLIVWIRLA